MGKLFQYTCSNPKNKKELKYILDNREEVTEEYFLSEVNEEDYNFLMEDINGDIKGRDKERTFFKSVNKENKDVFYINQLGKKYVFY